MTREPFVPIGNCTLHADVEITVARLHYQIHALLEFGIRACIVAGMSPELIVNSPQANAVQDGAGNELCRVTTVWSDMFSMSPDAKPGVTVKLEFSEFAASKVKLAPGGG